MKLLSSKDVMLCWTPRTRDVALIRWPDESGANRNYERSALACFSDFRKLSFEKRKAQIFIQALHLIVRDGCPSDAVHTALLGLEEYVDALADDMPRGAR